MQLNTMLRQSPPDPSLRQGLTESVGYLLEIIDKVRNLSHDLSPATLGKLGLTEAVRELLEDFQNYHGIATEAALDEVGPPLPQEARVGIYRILQEFLGNVHKHAQATKVKVAITALEDRVAVTMEDNGIGFNLEKARGKFLQSEGLGLLSMEARVQMLGGRFNLDSQKGKGTCLDFEIPRTSGGEFSETQ
jgi:two-component system NarL family sensor kinase